MDRPRSSGTTILAKFISPLVWIPLFGFGAVQAFLDPGTVRYNGVAGGGPPYIGDIFLAAWIFGSAIILWFAVQLKVVILEGDHLLVSNYWKDWHVPISSVTRVTQNRWVNVRPITIYFRDDVGFGKRATFIPRHHGRLFFWRADPEVEELRQLAGLLGRQR
jgi:hypothetical protein